MNQPESGVLLMNRAFIPADLMEDDDPTLEMELTPAQLEMLSRAANGEEPEVRSAPSGTGYGGGYIVEQAPPLIPVRPAAPQRSSLFPPGRPVAPRPAAYAPVTAPLDPKPSITASPPPQPAGAQAGGLKVEKAVAPSAPVAAVNAAAGNHAAGNHAAALPTGSAAPKPFAVVPPVVAVPPKAPAVVPTEAPAALAPTPLMVLPPKAAAAVPAETPAVVAPKSLVVVAPKAPAVVPLEAPAVAAPGRRSRASRAGIVLAILGICALSALMGYLAAPSPPESTAPPAAPVDIVPPPEERSAPPLAPATESPAPPKPVFFANPFDASEVFQFPPGTTETEARDAVADALLKRARERLNLSSDVKGPARHSGPRDAGSSVRPRVARRG